MGIVLTPNGGCDSIWYTYFFFKLPKNKISLQKFNPDSVVVLYNKSWLHIYYDGRGNFINI